MDGLQPNGNRRHLLIYNLDLKVFLPSFFIILMINQELKKVVLTYSMLLVFIRTTRRKGSVKKKEDFSWAPVWIRMFSLPQEYWDEETLKEIGNTLGTYVRSVDQTKMN